MMNNYFKSPITAVALCTGILVAVSCSTSREPRTMRLFMQSGRPNISLPHGETSHSGRVSEQVDFTTMADSTNTPVTESQDTTDNVWKTVRLESVEVLAARTVVKQVTMRRGSVRLEFDVTVPSVLTDSCWRVTLTPVVSSDSTGFPLPPVVLRGSGFSRMQEADYRAYDLFLKGIVDPSAYDSIYLDRKGIHKDIARRQKFFYDLYGKERDRQLAYEKWKRLALDRQNYWNMRTHANRTTLRHRLERKRIEESVRRYVAGSDTLGLGAAYERKYRRTASFWPMYRMERELTAGRVPSKFRDLYTGGRSLSDIQNHVLTAADSTDISRHRYFYDRIAENEMNDRNRDEIRRRMIPFPYIDSVMVRRNSDSIPGPTYTYNYVYSLPVTDGMKKLRVHLESVVEATDRSTWRPAASDTLLFVVASLSDLVDRSVLEPYVMASTETDSLSSGSPAYTPEGEEYAGALQFLSEHRYRDALPVLEKHPGYNTALCLTQLGYHNEASDLLEQLPPSARREYLLAVICARQGNEQTAVERLLDACRMDPDLVLRIPLDPELSDLIPKFIGLDQELDRIAGGN